MKNLGKSVLLVLALATMLTYSGCDKGTVEPTVEEVQLEKLSGTWTVAGGGNVTLNDVPPGTDYSNFELTLTGTPGATSFGYATAGRPTGPGITSPWPSTGTWEFGASPESMIVRDPDGADLLNMTYSVSDTQLQLTFLYTGPGYSRTSSVDGDWIFTLNRK